MKHDGEYENAPTGFAEAIGAAEVVDDFLPGPAELELKQETQKITISLTRRSVEFFRENATKEGVPYQLMIRKVLDL